MKTMKLAPPTRPIRLQTGVNILQIIANWVLEFANHYKHHKSKFEFGEAKFSPTLTNKF
jgi:hypothetical protein